MTDPSDSGNPLDALAGEYIDRLKRGEGPTIDEYIARHPELEGEIRAFFPALRFVADIGLSLDEVTGDHGPGLGCSTYSVYGSVVADPTDAATVCFGSAASSPRQPALMVGGYEILGELGRGGMGAVLKGHDPDLGRDLAIKILLDKHHDDPDLIRRFVEEAQIGGQLQHPGIVPVHRLGAMADRRPYFAMKLVKGRTLAELLNDRPSLSHESSRFLAIFEAICQTLAYAHSRGVIHRDLKPSNVMVGSFGEVQVMDWGLAKVLARDAGAVQPSSDESLVSTARSGSNSDVSHAGSILGTPAYMAPEQARGEIEAVDERADVFALGSILCVILTGEPAFTGRTGEMLARARRGDVGEALERLARCGADAELIALTRDCLAADRDARPRGAGEVSARMVAHLAGVQDRLRKAELARAQADARAEGERQKRRLTLGLAASLLLAVLIGGGSWMAFRLDRDSRLARTDRLVGDALGEARALLAEASRRGPDDLAAWNRAKAAADRAQDVLAGGTARDSLGVRVANLRAEIATGVARAKEREEFQAADRRLLAALDEARLQGTAVKGNDFDSEAAISADRAVFVDAGIRLRPDSFEQDSVRLMAGADPARVAATLDVVALNEKDPGRRSSIAALASRIDPDATRDRLRRALVGGDEADLLALAKSPEVARLSPRNADLLVTFLRSANHQVEANVALSDAWRRHPEDFWLNIHLASLLAERDRADRPQPSQEALTLAVRCCTAAVALRPESPGARVNLAMALNDAGQNEEAEIQAREAIRLKPDFPMAHFDLGVIQVARNQPAEAAFREAIRLKPGYAVAHINLSFELGRQGKRDEAEAEAREGLRLGHRGVEVHSALFWALRDTEKLFEAEAEALEMMRRKGGLIIVHVNYVRDKVTRLSRQEAEAGYRRLVRDRPDFAPAHFALGNFLRQNGKVREGIGEFREAIRLQPDFTASHEELARTLRITGDLAGAEASLREAIRLDPNLSVARQNLDILLHDQGRPPERNRPPEEGAPREAAPLGPKDAPAYYNRGRTLLSQARPAEAEAPLREATRLDPAHGMAYLALGDAFQQLGRLDEAEAAYREVIRIDPIYVPAPYRLGNLLYALGRPAEAEAAYREVIRLAPDYAEAHCNLGQALREAGKYAEAQAEMRRGHELGSRRPTWKYPSATWVREAERFVALEGRLTGVANGSDDPKDADERLAFAQMSHTRKLYATSARLWGELLALDPKLAEDRQADHLYNAACSAAMAASGRGKDDPKPDDHSRANFRAQALAWLRAKLQGWRTAAKADGKEKKTVAASLEHWKKDTDLAPVRDEAELAKLPDEERAAWRDLWAGVDALLKETKP